MVTVAWPTLPAYSLLLAGRSRTNAVPLVRVLQSA